MGSWGRGLEEHENASDKDNAYSMAGETPRHTAGGGTGEGADGGGGGRVRRVKCVSLPVATENGHRLDQNHEAQINTGEVSLSFVLRPRKNVLSWRYLW